MQPSRREAASALPAKAYLCFGGTGNFACARPRLPTELGAGFFCHHRFETLSLSATIYRFVTEHKQAKRYFVSGNVQGVGFRYFTLRAAERLQVNGYARNLPDGRVEAYAIGTPDQLAKLRSILERGPWGATVSEVKEEPAAIDSNYDDGFAINY